MTVPALLLRAGRLALTVGVAIVTTAAIAHAQLAPPPGPTAENIKKRGALACGVDTGVPGFAAQDNTGKWKGLDIDYCRAIAAAVLGDPDKVRYTPTTAAARFTVLQAGEIDVLIRDSTLTFTRSNQLGLDEVAVNFYAGQGFLVRKSIGVQKAAELQGATICMITGATLELNIADFARSTGAKIGSLLFEKPEEAIAAMEAGRCDGYSDDSGSLAGMRSTLKNPSEWIIMPELISKEPLGIHARSGDPRWQKILFWLDTALKTAEEFGITQANADELRKTSKNPFILRLLGAEGDTGKQLGLDSDWAFRAIKATGNYGEIYDRHFGPNALNLPRGLNNLYNNGGMHYTLPFR
ncbi:amino acid ABC transporter substrate-binding protein [Limobrevibacterium gyesilva]|uniref:Amino acid ABC transporter substrate-binding protein n=1 Tax=Limobrevibacterium gyesilva TaxID=2991712 RepID=A0AA41YMB4_9PROT|nr:amino acid ABC transporter substrate-binding protein [Limobrevibacterium gyesilva]MCW3476124.1 amino acid ABC transporter substrate-binding protein [Limobrevibacterium gyesilva]